MPCDSVSLLCPGCGFRACLVQGILDCPDEELAPGGGVPAAHFFACCHGPWPIAEMLERARAGVVAVMGELGDTPPTVVNAAPVVLGVLQAFSIGVDILCYRAGERLQCVQSSNTASK